MIKFSSLHIYCSFFCFKVDVGKSPLAMLAKTCETIGLPDTPSRKDKMKDNNNSSHSPSTSSTSGESKKDELSPLQKKKEDSKSPRTTTHSPKTPITSEPSTSTRANFFPMAFPPLGSSFPMFQYPPMMPSFSAIPTFPSGFPTAPSPTSYLRCADPTCKGCPPVSTPADMITAFSSPFFTSYNPLMAAGAVTLPPTSRLAFFDSSSFSNQSQLAYQNLMAAAASSQTSKHICNWPDTTGICGKTFNSADELASHMKVSVKFLSLLFFFFSFTRLSII
ncbi:unnamed protein product [Enterobius vermicularis]|uniref:C2H2-type domain-containing protein n=1 Tax=Enterobius vermicularis TaxID=51028 RepID=A0A0N4UTE8_ENTVE|nr:unnamed protein product [Enterobius vermicularis]